MKAVLITGVSSGTGLGITKKLLEKGYDVIGSVRTSEKAMELQQTLGSGFFPLIFDICNQRQVETAAEQLKKLLGKEKLAALINNAGAAEIGPLLNVSLEDFHKQLNTLVVGPLNVIQHFYEYLIPDDPNLKCGRIINISSISGEQGNYFFGCYAAGKHALEGLSKTLRDELKLFGIDVIVIAPGNIATSIWSKQTEDIIQKYRESVYYMSLQRSIAYIKSNILRNAMGIEEFSEAFLEILEKETPGTRYTIIKSRKRRIPFSKEKVRILVK